MINEQKEEEEEDMEVEMEMELEEVQERDKPDEVAREVEESKGKEGKKERDERGEDRNSSANLLGRLNVAAASGAKLARRACADIDETLEIVTKIDQILRSGEQANCRNIWEVKNSLLDQLAEWEERRSLASDSYLRITEERSMVSVRLEQIKKELNEITEANTMLESQPEPEVPLLLKLLSSKH